MCSIFRLFSVLNETYQDFLDKSFFVFITQFLEIKMLLIKSKLYSGKKITMKCEPEFFNTRGVHPETGKALKSVSEYMFGKYIKKLKF